MDRYQTLIALQQDIKEAEHTSTNRRLKNIDALATHLVENFKPGDLTNTKLVQDITDLFDRKLSIDVLDESVLRDTDDALVALSVVLSMVPFDANTEQYTRFGDIFGKTIMAYAKVPA